MTETSFRLLASLLLSPPATIEILPGEASAWISDEVERSCTPFLLTENNLGVPQKELRQSYLFAVRVFAAACKISGLHTPSHPITALAIQDLIDSSAVLIVMNPAHQTALNARKQLIERNLIELSQELKFTAALLSSRHCCKQGDLWYHRRWLLRRIYPTLSSHQGWTADVAPNPPSFRLTPNDLSVEISLVNRACELYPRNYFGWTHRTICIQSVLIHGMHSTMSDVFTEILSKEFLGITHWIESHISDYSAVHHLKTLAQLVEGMEGAFLPDNLQGLLPLIGHAVTLVHAFPEHETLWMYLRVFWVENDITIAFIASFVLPQSIGTVNEKSQYARRFLEWRNQRLK